MSTAAAAESKTLQRIAIYLSEREYAAIQAFRHSRREGSLSGMCRRLLLEALDVTPDLDGNVNNHD